MSSQRATQAHYWIKSDITEDKTKWEVGWLDINGNWWIFGVTGWFPESAMLEIGPEITPPAEQV